jgi:hypothetical protein
MFAVLDMVDDLFFKLGFKLGFAYINRIYRYFNCFDQYLLMRLPRSCSGSQFARVPCHSILSAFQYKIRRHPKALAHNDQCAPPHLRPNPFDVQLSAARSGHRSPSR